MKCPVCSETLLVMSERQGVEIDYCPTCRGVWLDRGELDKLLERQASSERDAHKHHDSGHDKYDHDEHRRQRRKSWLNELFD